MEIPKSVSSIGRNVFRGCIGLTRVMIPKNVTYMDAGAFADCGNLKEFAVAEDSNHYKSVGGLLLTKDGRTLLAVPGGIETVKIPDRVVNIGDYAFFGCKKVSKVSISDGVTSIGYKSFARCSWLVSVEIPPSVMKIGSSAFQDCTCLAGVYITDLAAWCSVSFGDLGSGNPLIWAHNLYCASSLVTNLKFPDDMDHIGDFAFYGCSCLTRVTISRSIKKVGYGAFGYCNNLVRFDVDGGNQYYKSTDGLLLTRDGKILVSAPA